MSEVRELLVSLNFNSGNAKKDIAGLSRAVKQAEADFMAAGAGIDNFAKTTDGLKAKVAQLTQTHKLQEQAVQKYGQAIEKQTAKLEKAKANEEGLANAVKDAKAAYDESVKAKGKDADETKKLAEELDKARTAQTQNANAMRSAAEEIQKNELAHTKAQAAVKGTAAELKKAEKDLDRYGSAWSQAAMKVEKATGEFGQKATKVGNSLTKTVTAPTVGMSAIAVKAAIDFESAWTGVTKTVDFDNEKQSERLRKQLLAMSETVPVAAKDIAAIAEAAGQLGIQTDNIADFSKVIIDLENSTNLKDGATQFAQFANIVGMAQGDFDRLGSTIVDLGNKFATNENDIMAMSMRLAAAGKQVKFTESQTMALATTMASLGVEAEAGGSAMSKVMLNMDMACAKGEKAVAGYAKVAGLSAKDFIKAWETEPAKALDGFIQGLGRIEQDGGNVALTLESLGYTEVRTRDALLRLTGAGNLFSTALGTADSAWRSNTALATEAGKRYDTTASKMQMLKNKATNIGISFGEIANPALQGAMDHVGGLLDNIKNLDPEMQKNILTMAAMAAATGPVISGIGKVSTGISAITELFSGPAGWVTLGLAGVAALGVAIASIETPSQKIEKRLQALKFDINTESVSKITGGINRGIEAADKLHTIQVQIEADTQTMRDELDAAFGDGKLSKNEFTSLTKWVNETVANDVKQAKVALEQKTIDFREALGAAVDASGSPIFSQERIEAQASLLGERTNGLISELEGYKSDYNALLKVLYKDGRTPTEAEIAQLDVLLGKMAEIRTQLQAEQEQAIKVQQAYADLAKQGLGGEEARGQAIGAVQGAKDRAIAAVKKEMDEQFAIIQAAKEALEAEGATQTERDALTVQQASIEENYRLKLDQITLDAQKEIESYYDGLAKANEKGAQVLEQAAADIDLINLIKKINLDPKAASDADWQGVFSADVMKRFFSDKAFAELSADEILNLPLGEAADILKDLQTKLGESVAAAIESGAANPFMDYIQAMFDSGSLADIDPTMANGVLADAFTLLDFTGKGEEYGLDFSQGIGTGIQSGEAEVGAAAGTLIDKAIGAFKARQGDAKTSGSQFADGFIGSVRAKEAAAFTAGAAIGAAAMRGLNSTLEIRSPSRASGRSGRYFGLGFINDMDKMRAKAEDAGGSLGLAALKGLKKNANYPSQELLTSLSADMERFTRGGHEVKQVTNSRSYDQRASLTVEKMIMQNEMDVQSLMLQMANMSRKYAAGYGAAT